MSSIAFNQTTKEIEIKGPESFIESNLHKIESIMRESFATMKKKVSGKTTTNREIRLSDEIQKSQTTQVMRISEISAPETQAAAKPGVQEVPEAPKATRPPVRKYFNTLGKHIRSEDTSIGKNQAVGLIGRTPGRGSPSHHLKRSLDYPNNRSKESSRTLRNTAGSESI